MSGAPKIEPMKVIDQKTYPVTANYDAIRQQFLQLASYSPAWTPPITDSHGFYIGGTAPYLTQRFTGIDKLFTSLVNGVVDDPDYALKKDLKIYEKMLRDPQIFYCLSVRKAAVSSLPWTVRPKANMQHDPTANRIAEACERRLRKIPKFAELLDNIMDALLPGLSLVELVWKIEGGEYCVNGHYPVSKDRIKFTREGQLRLLCPASPSSGIEVPNYKFIKHVFNVVDGTWRQPDDAGYQYYGQGLADTPLYHYFYFKTMALKYFMQQLERYGMPTKVFYTGPQNATLAAKLSSILAALKNDSVVGIPGKKGETEVQLLETSRSRQSEFLQFLEYIDGLITRTILGQELMTEMPGAGSYAAAAVHQSVFQMVNSRDKMLVEDTLNKSLVLFDIQLNMSNLQEAFIPEFVFKKSAYADAAEFIGLVQSAQNIGLAVSENQVREYTGLREPTENERALQPAGGMINGLTGSDMSALSNEVRTAEGTSNAPSQMSRVPADRSGSSKEDGNKGKKKNEKVRIQGRAKGVA